MASVHGCCATATATAAEATRSVAAGSSTRWRPEPTRSRSDGRSLRHGGARAAPARWGEGLATELALASVRTAFDVLGIDEVIAYTAPDNIASWRVMEKAGMEFDREIVAAGLPHVLYRARRNGRQD
jgi:RimJ/RimL family protein N-acetyltransferase